jgi:hypothetical protein
MCMLLDEESTLYGHIVLDYYGASLVYRLSIPPDKNTSLECSSIKARHCQLHHSIGLISSTTLNGASVFALTSSTVTPSASSIRLKPLLKSTSKTHYNDQSVHPITHHSADCTARELHIPTQ